MSDYFNNILPIPSYSKEVGNRGWEGGWQEVGIAQNLVVDFNTVSMTSNLNMAEKASTNLLIDMLDLMAMTAVAFRHSPGLVLGQILRPMVM